MESSRHNRDELQPNSSPPLVSDPVKQFYDTLDRIHQFYLMCQEKEDKFSALCNIYACMSIGRALIFCNSPFVAAWLTEKLKKEGHQVALLSRYMTEEQRAVFIQRFRDGKEKVLVTTTVQSVRDLDAERLTIVVNFDLPVDEEGNADMQSYLQRIGRPKTDARWFTFSMVGNHQGNILRQIQHYFDSRGRTISHVDHEDPNALEALHDLHYPSKSAIPPNP